MVYSYLITIDQNVYFSDKTCSSTTIFLLILHGSSFEYIFFPFFSDFIAYQLDLSLSFDHWIFCHFSSCLHFPSCLLSFSILSLAVLFCFSDALNTGYREWANMDRTHREWRLQEQLFTETLFSVTYEISLVLVTLITVNNG